MRCFVKLNFLVFPSCVDDKVCVVGIFGKDNIGYKSKAVHLNGTIGKEVFKVCCFRPLEKNAHSRSPRVVKYLVEAKFAQHD